MRNKILFTIGGIILAMAAGFGFGRANFENTNPPEQKELRDLNDGYRFLSPLLECDTQLPIFYKNIRGLENRVRNIIEEAKKNKKISFGSAYFRDLTNGPWFGVHDQETFLPSSLAKVPIMITFLKKIEAEPSLKERLIPLRETESTHTQKYMPSKTLEAGKSYTIQELIKQMIVYSDNTAADTLAKSEIIDPEYFNEIYNDFGILPYSDPNSKIDTHSYASFFRILYNSTYLSKELSEFALETLSETTFDQGLRAGVFKSIPIAHKFGERGDAGSGEKQLHDCGIIYFPGKPYVLCVMTRGTDFDQMSAVIANISKVVYEEVKKQ